MRLPWRKHSPLQQALDAELEWLSAVLDLIREIDPVAARRLALNIRDRLRLRPHDAHPLDTPKDVMRIALAELARVEKERGL